MTHDAALLIDCFDLARQASFRRLLSHHWVALPGTAPNMTEPQEIKGRGHRRSTRALGRCRKPEIDHTSLVRVQLQPVLAQSLSEHVQHALCVVLVRKQHYKVVAIANQCARSPQPRLYLFGKPFVQYVV